MVLSEHKIIVLDIFFKKIHFNHSLLLAASFQLNLYSGRLTAEAPVYFALSFAPIKELGWLLSRGRKHRGKHLAFPEIKPNKNMKNRVLSSRAGNLHLRGFGEKKL